MNDEDIIRSLRSTWTDFRITELDINHPTSEFIIEFYKRLLTELNIDYRKIVAIIQSQTDLEMRDYPDLLITNAIYISTKTVFEVLNLTPVVEMFSFGHLMQPTAKDVRLMLVLITNFLLYSNDLRANKLEPVYETILNQIGTLQQYFQQVDELKQRNNDLAVECATLLAEEEKLKEIEGALNVELEQLKVTRENNNQNINELKSVSNQLENEEAELQKELQQLTRNAVELKKLLVHDGPQLLKKHNALKQRVSERLKSEEIAEEKLTNANSLLQTCDNDLKIINKLVMEPITMDEMTAKYNAVDELKAEIKKFQEHMNRFEERKRAERSEIKRIKDEMKKLEKMYEKLKEQEANKFSVLDNEIIKRKEELNAKKKDCKKNKEKLKKFQKEIQQIEDDCVKLEMKYEEQNKMFDDIYKEILDNKAHLYATIKTCLSEIKEKGKKIQKKY